MKNIKETIKSYTDAKIPVWLWGAPGVGKSDIIKQIAADGNLELRDLRASLFEPIDFRGIPTVEKGQTIFNPVNILPTEGQGILFLDELSAAAEDTQKALLQLCLDRKLDDYELPDGWAIVAAGNRQSDDCGNMVVTKALLNRFAHIEVFAEIQAWSTWAKGKIHPHILKFVRNNSQLLETSPQEGQYAYPSPRTWEMASKAYSVNEDDKLLQYLVGPTAANAFKSFMIELNNSTLPMEMEEIVKDVVDKKEKSEIYKAMKDDPTKTLQIFHKYQADDTVESPEFEKIIKAMVKDSNFYRQIDPAGDVKGII